MTALCAYDWPGNVRELRNAVERLIILTPTDTIGERDLPAGLGMALGERAQDSPSIDGAIVIPHRGVGLQDFGVIDVHDEANARDVGFGARVPLQGGFGVALP